MPYVASRQSPVASRAAARSGAEAEASGGAGARSEAARRPKCKVCAEQTGARCRTPPLHNNGPSLCAEQFSHLHTLHKIGSPLRLRDFVQIVQMSELPSLRAELKIVVQNVY